MLGVGCTIVMPGDAPANKEARARSYGSDVVRSELVEGVNREITAAALAVTLAEEGGLTLLHPFEHPDVIAGQVTIPLIPRGSGYIRLHAWLRWLLHASNTAGQGSCGLEIAEQCQEKGVGAVDAVLICAGGGGLAAGCCLALSDRMPTAELYVVEPAGYDDHRM